mgnify:CR=1 FL=1
MRRLANFRPDLERIRTLRSRLTLELAPGDTPPGAGLPSVEGGRCTVRSQILPQDQGASSYSGENRPPMLPMEKELKREVFQIVNTANRTLTNLLDTEA